ncbi:hypothetical protein SDRG_12990 [Saprolegnia diclina VS20]|uniref:USP domain-containing protein n=1 Tax=Saprolegnia diclina (strain VS20) TaxID=1156394 RepID=T0Q400_SAPDV|nr:hypothetical protein SDRG_12990 [Saprolegnia diclina VS20]EQC29321.1 hypothetical protein SDRG_12990 [Saprolegnia diclina VS20]|eukprot:XP_008617295.1 hypothetical protein SDRG_12990 [Saprolegnia diclina VS20]
MTTDACHVMTKSQDDAGMSALQPAPIMTPASRYRGLRSTGATCYLNSLLQTLFLTPELRTRLYQSTSSANQDGILRELQLLFARLQLRADRKAIDTTSLTRSFGWTSTDALQQHDVHELYHVFLDALDASLQGVPDKSLVKDLYQGTLKDSVQCVTCGHESSHLDSFLDLSLGVPSTPTSVEEAIATFLAPERLVEDNQRICDLCGTKQNAIKQLSLAQLPPIITLQLKRFAWDHGTSKLTSCVSFPKYLDMNPHHPSTSSDPTIPSTTAQEAETKDTWDPDFDVSTMMAQGHFVYEIVSVLVHSGSADAGHYVAYIQSLDDDRRWLCFNDVSVSAISEAQLRTAYGLQSPDPGYYEATRAPCAYLLQYRQVDASRKIQCPAEVPSWLVDLVHAEMQREEMARDARRIAEVKRKADLANLLELKIFYDNSHKMIHVSKNATLADVTAEAVALFELHISIDCARLRAYSEYMALPRETYNEREHCLLVELSIDSVCSLYLEVRPITNQAWTVYDPTALTLRIRQYVPSTDAIPEHFTEPPKLVQIPGDARLVDLLSLLSAKLKMDRNQMRLLTMRTSGYWSISTTVLNPTNDETTLQQTLCGNLMFRDGYSIYVEAVDDLASSPSLAKELFVARAHSITLQVKTKEPTLLRAKTVEGDTMSWSFTVDRRQPLQELKDQLCTFFELRPETFKLRRAKENGGELKHLDMAFKNLSLLNQSTVWVELGAPLRAGEFRVNIQLHTLNRIETTTSSVVLLPLNRVDELVFCATLVVSATMLVSEMKTSILTVLQRTHPSAEHLRLRDVSSRRLQHVLSDDGTLGDASPISLYENRSFAVQILESPETLGAAHTLFSAVLFDRAHLTFGREMELVFPTLSPGSHWMDLLLLEIQNVFGIPLDAVLLAKPLQMTASDVTEMPQLSWIDRDHGRRIDRIASLALCGDRLVIADARVPSKELSTNELLDLQRRIDLEVDTNNTCLVRVGWSTNTVEMSLIESTQLVPETTTALKLRSSKC